MKNKKTAKEILEAYDRQIRRDMGFWIEYRPSRLGNLLFEKPIGPLIKFIKKKDGKRFILFLALTCLLFVGVIPTLNFILSNIFRLWLILLVIQLLYWSFAITSVYARVIIQTFRKFIRLVLCELIQS